MTLAASTRSRLSFVLSPPRSLDRRESGWKPLLSRCDLILRSSRQSERILVGRSRFRVAHVVNPIAGRLTGQPLLDLLLTRAPFLDGLPDHLNRQQGCEPNESEPDKYAPHESARFIGTGDRKPMIQNLCLAHSGGMKPGPRIGNGDQALPHARRFFAVSVGNENPGIVERSDELAPTRARSVVAMGNTNGN